MTTFLIVLLSLLVAVGRFFIPGHGASWPGTYEAFAHIWVGVLIALAITHQATRKLAIGTLLLITVLEAWLFFVTVWVR